tara:strand:- start:1820 stop:4135 length:2316 start_codon:yes stop_codon:yes gene_type:complete
MLGVDSYPTPDIRDLLTFTEVDSRNKKYNEPAYGSLYSVVHPDRHDKYANHKLVLVTPADENGQVKWYFAADRADQGAYNFQYQEPEASSGGSPSYTRTYFLLREDVGDYFDECNYVAAVTEVIGVAATGRYAGLLPPSDGDIVTIGTDVITYTLDGVGFSANAIDASVATATINAVTFAIALKEFVNGESSSQTGWSFPSRSFSTAVTAVNTLATVVDLTADATGVSGNSVVTTTDITSASWVAATLEGGVDAVTDVAASAYLGITLQLGGNTVTCGEVITFTFNGSAPWATNAINLDSGVPGADAGGASFAIALKEFINGESSSQAWYSFPASVYSTAVTATVDGSSITVTATATGTAGNSIAVSDTLFSGAWLEESGGSSTSFLVGGVTNIVAESGHPAGSDYLAPGSADPDLSFNPEWCDFVYTSQKVLRVPEKELDSRYILVQRTFEKHCAKSGKRLNNRTGLLEDYTNQIVLNSDLATSGIDSNGVATTSSPLNCDFSMQTTSTVRPLTTLSYDSTINYSWPAVLDYVDMLSWSLLDGSSSRYYPRLVWKRNAYNGPTRVTIKETWSKNPPTVPEIVTLETTAVLFACPLYSVNTGPCLHEEAWFNCGFGTNDPVWKWQNVVRSTSATEYTDWPTDPFIAAATVTNTNGGFLLRTLTINGRPPAYSAPSAPLVAGFAVAPYATGSTSIKMVASLGGASVLPVSFYFSETSGNPGGADSGWQTSNTYTNTGLSAGTQYTYTVKMRDGDVPPTEGPESAAAVATTDA